MMDSLLPLEPSLVRDAFCAFSAYDISEMRVTALASLAKAGCADCTKRLVQVHGADVNFATAEGFTVLHAACCAWDIDNSSAVVALLDLGADISAASKEGKTALHYAVGLSNRGTIHSGKLEALVKHANNSSSSSAVAAAETAALLANADSTGQTVLHTVMQLFEDLDPRLIVTYYKALDTLLTFEPTGLAAALLAVDSKGRTALHMAVELRVVRAVQRRLEACAKLGIVEAVLKKRDFTAGVDALCLVKRIAGEDLVGLFALYCPEVCLHHNTSHLYDRHCMYTACKQSCRCSVCCIDSHYYYVSQCTLLDQSARKRAFDKHQFFKQELLHYSTLLTPKRAVARF
jgi:Ankyrin repeats (3 copies)